MTDDIETLRRKNERLQVALAEANAVREACAQRAFRLEAEVERLRDELRQSSIDIIRAEIERLREEIAALKEERRKDMAEICSLRESEESLREENERLREEIAALRADAERYRWLREGCAQGGIGHNFFGEKIDAAIDAAMQQAALRREEAK